MASPRTVADIMDDLKRGSESAEIWVPMAEWPYHVSNLGNVRNAFGKVLAKRLRPNGYIHISARRPGAGREFYVHRIVCEAFHGPPPDPLMHVDHIDGNRANNAAINLRWLTPQENRARRNTARGERTGKTTITEADVRVIRAAGFAPGQDAEIARKIGVRRETVRDIRLGKAWRHVVG